MKWLLLYFVAVYIIACADAVHDSFNPQTRKQQFIRAILWPITITTWFRKQPPQLFRMLNILWALLIFGWLLSLITDRI